MRRWGCLPIPTHQLSTWRRRWRITSGGRLPGAGRRRCTPGIAGAWVMCHRRGAGPNQNWTPASSTSQQDGLIARGRDAAKQLLRLVCSWRRISAMTAGRKTAAAAALEAVEPLLNRRRNLRQSGSGRAPGQWAAMGYWRIVGSLSSIARCPTPAAPIEASPASAIPTALSRTRGEAPRADGRTRMPGGAGGRVRPTRPDRQRVLKPSTAAWTRPGSVSRL